MKQTHLIALLFAASLMACSSDDESAGTKEEKRLIYVDVSENPLTDPSAAAKERMTTRIANPTTTATLASFSMNYLQSFQYNFKKTGNSWSTNSWPTSAEYDDKIDFYAYTGGSFQYNNGDPYVNFTIDEDAFKQHDLLVAEHKQIAWNDADGHVSLLFDHACTALTFKVVLTNTLRNNLGHDLTVTSIVLKNVRNTGSYYYNNKNHWANVNGSANYTLTNSDITVTTTAQELPCGYLFMIPQTRDADGTNGTYLEINYTTSDQPAYIPMDINWETGVIEPIEIRLGTSTIQE